MLTDRSIYKISEIVKKNVPDTFAAGQYNNTDNCYGKTSIERPHVVHTVPLQILQIKKIIGRFL